MVHLRRWDAPGVEGDEMANSISETSDALLSQTAESLPEAGFPVKAKTLATKARRRESDAYTDRVIVAARLGEGTSDCATLQFIRTRFSRAITRLKRAIPPHFGGTENDNSHKKLGRSPRPVNDV